jgi:hypothetical protein
VLAFLVSIAAARMAPAQTDPPARAEASAVPRLEGLGFNGYYKLGRWTAARITFETAGPGTFEAVAHVRDPDGCPTSVPYRVRAEAPGRQDVTVYFKNGRLDAVPHFELVELDADGGRSRAVRIERAEEVAARPALRQAAFLVAVLGTAAGLGETVDATGGRRDTDALPAGADVPLHIARLDSSERLPADVLGYDALDALVIAGRYDLPDDRIAAVREWVRLGGHLVVAVGAEVEHYRASSLGQWLSGEAGPLPLTGDESVRLRELSGLESYSGQNVPIEVPRREVVSAAPLAVTGDAVLVRALGDVPLIVRVPYGFGRITCLAVDLDRPPLTDWSALPALMHRVLGIADVSRPAPATRSGRLAHSGVTDLASQLTRAQQEFPNVRRPSLWMVLGLLVGYLLLIGPLDYLLVHRLLRRPHATWVTFPLLVAGAAGLAIWTARSTNGEQVRVNRVDLIDVDGQFQSVRTRSWMTLYTPATRRYKLAAEPGELARGLRERGGRAPGEAAQAVVSWSGTPEEVFGGMYRVGGLDIGRPAYRFGSGAHSIANLPLTIWATKDLEAQWHNQAARVVESDLSLTPAGQLRGRFTHHLPVPIEDWVVAVGRRVYLPGRRGQSVSLAPGTAWPAGADWELVPPPRDLTAWLTGTTAVRIVRADRQSPRDAEEYHMRQRKYDPFDPANPDPLAEIVRMITFHRAAGGKTYTGLDSHALRGDDLSEQLELGRAVLFGRIDLPATEFRLNGEPVDGDVARRATFVRIVLPVAPAERR